MINLTLLADSEGLPINGKPLPWRHEKMLPSGKRAGFFIGDGTGVGKGRELAAIIWE
jgi:hypothetical protein